MKRALLRLADRYPLIASVIQLTLWVFSSMTAARFVPSLSVGIGWVASAIVVMKIHQRRLAGSAFACAIVMSRVISWYNASTPDREVSLQREFCLTLSAIVFGLALRWDGGRNGSEPE